MSNVKISALPTTGVSTPEDYFVIDDAALTTTSKIQLKNFVGLISGGGTDSMQSAPHLTSAFPANASGNYAIALGYGASGTSSNGIAIGYGAEATSPDAIAIGTRAYNANRDGFRDKYIAIGYEAEAVSDTFALGTRARALGTDVVAIGRDSVGTGNGQISIGAAASGSGTDLVCIGKNSGGLGINMNNSIIIGASNTMSDNTEEAVIIGNNISSAYSNSTTINTDGADSQGAHSIQIGCSGYTWSASGSDGMIQIGGFNNTVSYPIDRVVIIGGQDNVINSGANLGFGNVLLGLSGRTTPLAVNHTFVENLYTYGQHQFRRLELNDAGTCIFNPSEYHYVNVTATGGTYNITSNVNPTGPATQVVFYIEYFSGATINFTDGTGFINWRWDRSVYGGNAPVFSATTAGTPSRSIITVATWDNQDYWEVSRSMNME